MEHVEYKYQDGAPSFTLRFATADGNLTDSLLLHSALMKRNEHNILKLCLNEMATAEVLGLVFLEVLEKYSAFINCPRVFSF